MSSLAVTQRRPDLQLPEAQVITLRGVSWQRFQTIAQSFADIGSVRLTFIDGLLEIMSPIGPLHERLKSTLCLLLETYLREKGIRFYVKGGFTLAVAGRAAGEPDASYCLNRDRPVPDIVLEVIVTSGSLDKRALYLPLGVPELWFWQGGQLTLFELQGEGARRRYAQVNRSRLLPDLPVEWLSEYMDCADQYDAVQAFQARLRGDAAD